jgi:hypothetical protein
MKYLTAEKLGVSPEDRAALLKVKRFLKDLNTPKEPLSRYNHRLSEVSEPARALFNMNRAIHPYDCGTAGCIGGWMFIAKAGLPLRKRMAIPVDVAREAIDYVAANKPHKDSGPLTELFFPDQSKHNLKSYDNITPQMAIEQITLFLKTGNVTW